jgi:hypothetical protein
VNVSKFSFFGLIDSRRTLLKKSRTKARLNLVAAMNQAGWGSQWQQTISNVPRKMREFNHSSKVSRRLLVSS